MSEHQQGEDQQRVSKARCCWQLDPNKYVMKEFDKFPKEFIDQYYKHNHPSFAQITLPVQMPDSEKYCIGFEVIGEQLEVFAKKNKDNLCHMHLISKDYQSIIVDLMHLVRYLTKVKYDVTLDENIMVCMGPSKPTISLVNLSITDKVASLTSWWKQLANYLTKINGIISYNPGQNMEMAAFLSYLGRGCRQTISAARSDFLASLPLFWTPLERRTFVGDVWDYTKNVGADRLHIQAEPVFTKKPADWRTVMTKELPLLVNATPGGLGPLVPYVAGRRFPEEEETRSAMSFTRSWLVHPENMVDQLKVLWAAKDATLLADLAGSQAQLQGALHDLDQYQRLKKEYDEKRAKYTKEKDLYGDFNVDKLHIKFEEVFPRHVEMLQKKARLSILNLLGKTSGSLYLERIKRNKSKGKGKKGKENETEERALTLLVPLRRELLCKFSLPTSVDDSKASYF